MINYMDYDKISDRVLDISRDISLNFNVILGRKNQDNNRVFFHSEYSYKSKYNNIETCRSIKRKFDYYLTIDVYNKFDDSIMLRGNNVMMIRMYMKTMFKWFNELFKIIDNKLVISGEYEPIVMDVYNKQIKFEPTVLAFPDGNRIKAIDLYVNNSSNVASLSFDKFMELWYYFDKLDMYQNAITLLNYLQRPEFGTNEFSFDYNDNYSINSNAKFKKSFFDK